MLGRYKTELCKHGNKEACKSKRAFCFFAHSEEELRAVPENETISLEADFSSKEPQALQPSTLEAHLVGICGICASVESIESGWPSSSCSLTMLQVVNWKPCQCKTKLCLSFCELACVFVSVLDAELSTFASI